MSNSVVLVPDVAALQRKLETPSPRLEKVYGRFRERLTHDGDFRRHHIYLPALLGDPVAIAEAKGQLLMTALNPLILAKDQSPGSRTVAQDSLDAHIWCMAPRAMRLAVYFTWLDRQGAWTAAERRLLGQALVGFFYDYVVPVLRARVPGGHNQQFSMTLCSAIVGHVFADTNGVETRAHTLREWALPKLKQVLGLLPASGYSGEGTTYQSDVISALSMWCGTFLEQLGYRDIWNHRWEPNGWRLSDALRMEVRLGSEGGLLLPWDNYGWSRLHNLAARARMAALSGDIGVLRMAETVWDDFNFLAWRPDDRLWTLLYWPEHENPDTAGAGHGSPLSGWSECAVGASVEHLPRRLRVALAWDRCASGVQGVSREQVNPNHLMIELGGEPISADGSLDPREKIFPDEALARSLERMSAVERDLIVEQYGSIERWTGNAQQGFLGASCSIVIDGWEGYFPAEAREGRLLFERRDPVRHTVTGEAAAYYQPAFDVSRMRRTVSVGVSGVTWVVDDLQAPTEHAFTWRMWLRRCARQIGPHGVRLDLPSGVGVTLTWRVETDGGLQTAPVALTTVPTFPLGHGWPDEGSERCDLCATGRRIRFVTCMVPEGVSGLSACQVSEGVWEAVWQGGSDRFELPPEVCALPDLEPVSGRQILERDTFCDLDEAPFALRDEPDAALLAFLDDPPVEEWRRTGAVMQTLTVRGNRDAMPLIITLLLDPRQNYTVRSVAAWCLGHARYAPAREALRRMAHIPEVNTSARAHWALERMALQET